MTDREKVINELRFQLDSKKVKDEYYPVQLSASDATAILALLKEQEPQPVLSPHIDRFCMRGFAEYIAYCPNCKQEILERRNKSYCGFCGQKVKWDEKV